MYLQIKIYNTPKYLFGVFFYGYNLSILYKIYKKGRYLFYQLRLMQFFQLSAYRDILYNELSFCLNEG